MTIRVILFFVSIFQNVGRSVANISGLLFSSIAFEWAYEEFRTTILKFGPYYRYVTFWGLGGGTKLEVELPSLVNLFLAWQVMPETSLRYICLFACIAKKCFGGRPINIYTFYNICGLSATRVQGPQTGVRVGKLLRTSNLTSTPSKMVESDRLSLLVRLRNRIQWRCLDQVVSEARIAGWKIIFCQRC